MINFKIYTQTHQLPQSWNTFVSHDIFLQNPYLSVLEKGTPNNLNSYFLGVFKNNSLVGVAIIQHIHWVLKDAVGCRSDIMLKNLLTKNIKGSGLVIGNLMHTGQHGLFYDEKSIVQADFLKTVLDALKSIRNTIKKENNQTPRLLVLKDYFPTDGIHSEKTFLEKGGYHYVKVQPNMIFHVEPHWNTTEDYIADFKKKYKRRFKTARKKLGNIQYKELTLEDIQQNNSILHNLYLNVLENAKFNTFVLPVNHFSILKTQLKEQFKLFGYFLDDKLVGFHSLLLNNKVLETYFLGYNPSVQHKHQLYLNMLFNMAEFGINNGFKSIVYARTAMEIKSSIGAKPHDMVLYMKHTNALVNCILKLVVKYINPKKDWEERHPFK